MNANSYLQPQLYVYLWVAIVEFGIILNPT